jgi:hypothetical protein
MTNKSWTQLKSEALDWARNEQGLDLAAATIYANEYADKSYLSGKFGTIVDA